MEITSVDLTPAGLLTVTATGIPTQTVEGLRNLGQMILGPKGPWRISEIHGFCGDGDDKMNWTMIATLKNRRIE